MDTIDAYGCGSSRANRALDLTIEAAAVSASSLSTWQGVSAAATLVVTANGGPIRTIITGRRRITTGSYASVKAGRSLPFESMNERAFLMDSEVDTSVVDYRAQPFRLELVIGGVKRAYIPDGLRLLDTGSLEVIEIKKDWQSLSDPDYASKLECVAKVCELVGWRFRIIYASELFQPPQRYRNVLDVQSWRLTEYSDSDLYRIAARLDVAKIEALGVLSDLLGGGPSGNAKLKAMMVGRVVRIDLNEPISRFSLVERVRVPRLGQIGGLS